MKNQNERSYSEKIRQENMKMYDLSLIGDGSNRYYTTPEDDEIKVMFWNESSTASGTLVDYSLDKDILRNMILSNELTEENADDVISELEEKAMQYNADINWFGFGDSFEKYIKMIKPDDLFIYLYNSCCAYKQEMAHEI